MKKVMKVLSVGLSITFMLLSIVGCTSNNEKIFMDSDGSYYDQEGYHYSADGKKLEDKISKVELTTRVGEGTLEMKEIETKKK